MRHILNIFILLFALIGLVGLPFWVLGLLHPGHTHSSTERKVHADLNSIANQLELYNSDRNAYPDSIDDLVGA